MKIFRIIKLIFHCLELIIQAVHEFLLNHENEVDLTNEQEVEQFNKMKELQSMFCENYLKKTKKLEKKIKKNDK